MAVAGRKPKPTLQVVREGNPGKRPVKEGVVLPPEHVREPDWTDYFPGDDPEVEAARATAQELWRRTAATLERSVGLVGQQQEALRILSPWAERYADGVLQKEVGAALEVRREWSFHFRLLSEEEGHPAVWLSGQVDLVLFYPDGSIGIVDYKTDHIDGDSLHKKAARYRLQIAGYALAAEVIMKRPVRDARLYFARLGEIVSVAVDRQSLDSARSELQTMAEFIRSHQREADYACRTERCGTCPFQAVCLQE